MIASTKAATIPPLFHDMLAHAVKNKCLESLADHEGWLKYAGHWFPRLQPEVAKQNWLGWLWLCLSYFLKVYPDHVKDFPVAKWIEKCEDGVFAQRGSDEVTEKLCLRLMQAPDNTRELADLIARYFYLYDEHERFGQVKVDLLEEKGSSELTDYIHAAVAAFPAVAARYAEIVRELPE